MQFNKLLSLAVVVAAAGCAWAGELSITAQVNRDQITLDDQLALEVSVSGSASGIPDPQLPSIPNFTAYSSGRSQNISFINGKMSSSTSFTYVLAPRAPGKYVIPPITVSHGGKTVQTQPINIEVLPAGKAPVQNQQNHQTSSKDDGKNIFVTASVNKPVAYVNEQIIYTFKFFRRIRLLSNPQYSPPDFSGFWTEDTAPKNYRTTLNGQAYMVTEVNTILFPTKPGSFNLGSPALQCSIEDFSQKDPFGDDFFANFFSGGKNQVLRADAVTIKVLPLPEQGKPRDFSGAVGNLGFNSSLDKKTLKANEPVTLSITVSGNGSIKTIQEPKLPEWPDFKKYETVSSLDLNTADGISKGSKTFKTVIIPLTPGNKKLGSLSFSYFDPSAKRYITLNSKELSLDVKPGDAAAAVIPAVPGQQSGAGDIKVVNRDIRFIKQTSANEPWTGYLYKKTWFILLNIVPFLALLAAFLFIKWQERLKGDVAFARRLRAQKVAKKYIKNAKKHLSDKKPFEYYCAVSKTLVEYIGDKLNLSPDGLTFALISEHLSKKGVSPSTLEIVRKISDECDMVRYAPSAINHEMMGKTLDELVNVIELLEKEVRI